MAKQERTTLTAFRQREQMFGILNKIAQVLLTRGDASFDKAMSKGLNLLAEITGLDRMSVFRNTERTDGLYLSQVYRWRKEIAGLLDAWPELKDIPQTAFASQLIAALMAGKNLSGTVDTLPGNEIFKQFGCVTVLVMPVFDDGKFWGAVLFERLQMNVFSEDEADILRSVSAMLATAVIRNEESEALRRANEQSQLMLDAVPLAVTMWNKEKYVIDCSENAVRLLGFPNKRDVIERFFASVPQVQPDGTPSRCMMTERLNLAFEQGYGRFEFTHLTTGGELVVCDVSLSRITYRGSTVVLAYARDIREEKKMLAELACRDEMLMSQNHWYQSVLDGIPVPLHVTDANMNVTFINKAAENCFGKKREEMMSKPCHHWNTPICGTERCSIVCAKQGEKQAVFKHGGLTYQVNSEVLTDLAGNTIGFVEAAQNVTDVESMARSQADEENKAKSTFLATMSHEMRTPLNAVIGMTAVGRRSASVERKNYALDKIEEASAHLLGVINDILDMSKIEAGKLELSSAEYNFEKMLQRVITVISQRVHEKRQKLSINISGSIPRFVIGDDQRLAQVIANLLSNATKFTFEGGEIRLNVSMLSEENGVCELGFEVSDTGIGISAAQQKKLFYAFGQANQNTTREFGGTGLGLSISKRLVEMMDGKIWVESEQGKGSRFIFTIKVSIGMTNPHVLLRPDIFWTKLRILVVDGSESTRQYFKDSFEQLGVTCDIAADGCAAQQLIERHGSFDVCFVSWRMPGMDGASLTRWIKSRREKGAVVLISSADWENLQEAVGNCGADKGLIKPVLSSALIDCLNELLGNAGKGHNYDNVDDFAGKTLLLAEDIEINREIVISLLEGTGIAIDCAANGAEALAMVEANPDKYDIVFMDVQMPIMDGLNATRCIRALPLPQCRKIPIVAMTANVFKDDMENCFAAGMNNHISKPVNVDDMLNKLRQYLNDGAFVPHNEYMPETTDPLSL